MTTYRELGIPYASDFRSGNYLPQERMFKKAHAKEMKRKNARAGNWGWVIAETGIASKTSEGILETNIRDGRIVHQWTTWEEHYQERRKEQL